MKKFLLYTTLFTVVTIGVVAWLTPDSFLINKKNTDDDFDEFDDEFDDDDE